MAKELTQQAKYTEPLVFELESTKYQKYRPPKVPDEITKVVGSAKQLIPEKMQRKDKPNLPWQFFSSVRLTIS